MFVSVHKISIQRSVHKPKKKKKSKLVMSNERGEANITHGT